MIKAVLKNNLPYCGKCSEQLTPTGINKPTIISNYDLVSSQDKMILCRFEVVCQKCRSVNSYCSNLETGTRYEDEGVKVYEYDY